MDLALEPRPVDLVADPLAAWIFMGANFMVSVGAITAALIYAYRHRDSLPLFCIVGGAFAMVANEPILDHLLLVWYPANSPWVIAHFFEIGMPAYLLFGYPWYVGLGAFVVHKAIERGVSTRTLWRAYAVVAVLDFIIEVPSTAAGVHIYYGVQPNFYKHGLAVSIPFLMSAVTMIAGIALYHILQRTTGWRARLATVVVVPSTAAGTLVATQWPVMTAQNSNGITLVVWATAVVSIGISLAATWFAFSTVPTTDSSNTSRDAPMGLAT